MSKGLSMGAAFFSANQTGEAAGVAAVLARRAGCAVGEVAIERLRSTLADLGAVVL